MNFNETQTATTSITVNNLPYVAGAIKSAMMGYQYADKCKWYEALKNATSVKDIMGVFNIGLHYSNAKEAFVPVIKDIEAQAGYMDLLKAVAPYMEDGSLYAKDDYRYYTINFNGGKVTGTRRTIGETPAKPTTPPPAPAKPAKPSYNKPANKKQTSKKQDSKKGSKFKFTAPTVAPVTMKRADNTYTVQELVRELLKQMDMGNGSKRVTIQADFLFQNEVTA